jgi:hypothetical protein
MVPGVTPKKNKEAAITGKSGLTYLQHFLPPPGQAQNMITNSWKGGGTTYLLKTTIHKGNFSYIVKD